MLYFLFWIDVRPKRRRWLASCGAKNKIAGRRARMGSATEEEREESG